MYLGLLLVQVYQTQTAFHESQDFKLVGIPLSFNSLNRFGAHTWNLVDPSTVNDWRSHYSFKILKLA